MMLCIFPRAIGFFPCAVFSWSDSTRWNLIQQYFLFINDMPVSVSNVKGRKIKKTKPCSGRYFQASWRPKIQVHLSKWRVLWSIGSMRVGSISVSHYTLIVEHASVPDPRRCLWHITQGHNLFYTPSIERWGLCSFPLGWVGLVTALTNRIRQKSHCAHFCAHVLRDHLFPFWVSWNTHSWNSASLSERNPSSPKERPKHRGTRRCPSQQPTSTYKPCE